MLEPVPPASRPAWMILQWTICALGLLGGVLACFYPMLGSGCEMLQTDPGDTPFNNYVLEHSWRWISDENYPASFWTPQFYYPTRYTLTYSENMIGAAPIYWGLRLFFEENVSFQWCMLIFCATNYMAMAVVLRWFGVNPVLAVAGAYLFAFGLPRQDQFGHQQLLPHAFAPFAVWYFWRFQQQPDRKSWSLLLLMTAWQLFASIHLGWFLMAALGVWFIITLIFVRGVLRRCFAFTRDNQFFVFISLLAWVAVVVLFFRNYFIGNHLFRRSYSECLFFMPYPSSWFSCSPHSLWESRLCWKAEPVPLEQRQCSGVGLPLAMLVGIVGAWRMRRSQAERNNSQLSITTILTALVLVVLSTRLYGDHSLWYFVYHAVPGANAIRAPGRVVLTVTMFGVIGGLVAIQSPLDSRIRMPWRCLVISLGITALIVREQVRTEMEWFDRSELHPRIEILSDELNDADAAFVGLWPLDYRGEYVQQIVAIWAGIESKMPMVNGYSGRTPMGFGGAAEFAEINMAMAVGTISEDAGLKRVAARIVEVLGPEWKGTLLLMRERPAMKKWYFKVAQGFDHSKRATLWRIE